MKVCVNDTTLRDIATAVRERLGVNTKYKPSEIPQAIRNIEGSGFDLTAYASGNLTKLTIPGTVETVKYNAFNNLEKLEEITIAEGVKTIESGKAATNTTPAQGAFYLAGYNSTGCQLNIPSTLTSIGDYAFDGLKPKGYKIVIPANVTTIGKEAFAANYLEVYFKGTPTSVGNKAFYRDAFFSGLDVVTRKIYVPWSEGEGPDLGINTNTAGANQVPITEIIYDYVYEE